MFDLNDTDPFQYEHWNHCDLKCVLKCGVVYGTLV